MNDVEQFFYDHDDWSYSPATETPNLLRVTAECLSTYTERHTDCSGEDCQCECHSEPLPYYFENEKGKVEEQ